MRAAGLLLLLALSLPFSLLGVFIMFIVFGIKLLLGSETLAERSPDQQKTAIVTGEPAMLPNCRHNNFF